MASDCRSASIHHVTITTMYTIDSLLHGDFGLFWIVVKHLIMPALVLAYGSLAVVTRMVRGGMLEVMNQDYIRTARAKGLREQIGRDPARMKNALLPTITVLGLQSECCFQAQYLLRSSSHGPASAATQSRGYSNSTTTRSWARRSSSRSST